jgi:hypothetical protein
MRFVLFEIAIGDYDIQYASFLTIETDSGVYSAFSVSKQFNEKVPKINDILYLRAVRNWWQNRDE